MFSHSGSTVVAVKLVTLLFVVHLVPATPVAADEAEPTTISLPTRYDASVVCGGGRYLAVRLVDGAGIVVVDLAEHAIAHTIENPPDDALLAGGRDVLLLVSPGNRLVQRYRLEDFRRDKVAALPFDGVLKAARMGANSAGPLLLGGDEAVLVDVETLKPIEVEGPMIGAWSRYGYVLRVSANGRTFAGIPDGYGPVGYTRMRVDGSHTSIAKFGSTSHANRWAQPSADGHLVFTPGGGLFGPNLAPARVAWLNDSTCFPTVDPGYFVSVRFVAKAEGGFDTHFSICTTADRRIVHTVVGLPEMVPRGNTNERNGIARRLVYGEERFLWSPTAAALVTRPYDDASLVLRRFDLDDALAATGEPYLFVDSVPPTSVRAGERHEYRLHARSSRGRVRFELADGPEGLTLAKKGVIRWRVPQDAPGGLHTIVVRATSGDTEAFHTYVLAVEASTDSASTPAE